MVFTDSTFDFRFSNSNATVWFGRPFGCLIPLCAFFITIAKTIVEINEYNPTCNPVCRFSTNSFQAFELYGNWYILKENILLKNIQTLVQTPTIEVPLQTNQTNFSSISIYFVCLNIKLNQKYALISWEIDWVLTLVKTTSGEWFFVFAHWNEDIFMLLFLNRLDVGCHESPVFSFSVHFEQMRIKMFKLVMHEFWTQIAFYL